MLLSYYDKVITACDEQVLYKFYEYMYVYNLLSYI